MVRKKVEDGVLCGEKIKYLSADLRPVFSVWASSSRYYIDGKSISIPGKAFQLADTDSLTYKISRYKMIIVINI